MTLPEGRAPLTWQDMPFADKPKGHPSTERLEIEKLQARVAELEAALGDLLEAMDAVDAEANRAEQPGANRWSSVPVVRLDYKRTEARAALNPPQEPPEATTDRL